MKLLVLNDIFDLPSPRQCISTLLVGQKSVNFLSLNKLCGMPHLSGETLHHHLFKCDGIGAVINALISHSDPYTIGIGYSAGGTALWRAAQAGMELKALFCVSSTRLRELGTIVPQTHTYFGTEDPYKPNETWLANTPTNHRVFENLEHGFYLGSPSSHAVNARHVIANDIVHFHAQCQVN